MKENKGIEKILVDFHFGDGAICSIWNTGTKEYTLHFDGADLIQELKKHELESNKEVLGAFVTFLKSRYVIEEFGEAVDLGCDSFLEQLEATLKTD